ncbi:ATP-binding protein [Streptomyces sp. NPDC057301]|uniref:ATP-binding protein n=1 Tax=Streptomyces sp. NPDC057301 TaxID=3346093 RepID=UPI0036332733
MRQAHPWKASTVTGEQRRLNGGRQVATPAGGRDPRGIFVGRAAELNRLGRCSSLARSGKPTGILLLGEAGVGKTSLARFWLASRAMSGFTVLKARCHSDESDYPFGLVEQLASCAPGDAVESGSDFHSARLGKSTFQVGRQLLRMFDLLQDINPVAIVIDDIQWADVQSLRSLAFALRRMEADHVVVLMIGRSLGGDNLSVRPEAEALVASLEDNGHVERIFLSGLAVEEIDELVRQLRPENVSVGLAQRLAASTDGNALYVCSLLSEMSSEKGEEFPAAGSLGAVLRRQLSTLPAPSRALVEATAVLGSQASLALVASMAEVADPIAALEPALASGFLHWNASGSDNLVAFRHPLQCDAVIASMSPARLRAMHATAGERLPSPERWAHLVASTVSFDRELATQLEGAANEQIDLGDSALAATLLLLAAQVADSRNEEERLLLSAAVQLISIDHFSRVESLLPRVRACRRSPLRSLVLGAVALSKGYLDAAEAELQSALDGSKKGTEFEWVAPFAATWLSIRHSFTGDGEATVEACRRVLSADGISPALAARAKARLTQGRSYVDGPKAGLRELALMAAIPPRPATSIDAYLLMIRSFSRCWIGEMTGAANDLAVALPKVQEWAGPDLEFGYIHLSLAQFHLGNWDEAAINADRALAIAAAEDKPWTWAVAYATAVTVPATRGLSARAEEYLLAAHQWSDRFAPAFCQSAVAAATAWTARAKNDPATMVDVLSPLLGRAGLPRAMEGNWLPLYVEAMVRNDLCTEGESALARLCELAAEFPSLRLLAARLSGLAHLIREDRAGAEEQMGSALDSEANPNDSPFELALLQQSYGELQLLLGRHTQATAWLRRAADSLELLGARPYLQRCLERLDAAGDSPRPGRGGNGLAKLTTREAEIASLIGRGLTNNEISSELFISAKTVEYHLGNIYARLHISGRRELRDAVQQNAVDLGG